MFNSEDIDYLEYRQRTCFALFGAMLIEVADYYVGVRTEIVEAVKKEPSEDEKKEEKDAG